jgi:hypothetical protein
MTHAADDGEFIGVAGELGQMLGDLHARDLRVDRLELAADFLRRAGFEIERIQMRRSSAQIHENGRLGDGGLHLARARQTQIASQAEAAAKSARLQKVAASNAIAISVVSHGGFFQKMCD